MSDTIHSVVIVFPGSGVPSKSTRHNLARHEALRAWEGSVPVCSATALHQMRELGRWLTSRAAREHGGISWVEFGRLSLGATPDADEPVRSGLLLEQLEAGCLLGSDQVPPLPTLTQCEDVISSKVRSAMARQTTEFALSESARASARRNERELLSLFSIVGGGDVARQRAPDSGPSSAIAARRSSDPRDGEATRRRVPIVSTEELVTKLMSTVAVRDLLRCEAESLLLVDPPRLNVSLSTGKAQLLPVPVVALADSESSSGGPGDSESELATGTQAQAESELSGCAASGHTGTGTGIGAGSQTGGKSIESLAESSVTAARGQYTLATTRAQLRAPWADTEFLQAATEWLIEAVMFAPTVRPHLRSAGSFLLARAVAALAGPPPGPLSPQGKLRRCAAATASCFVADDEPAFLAILSALRLSRPPKSYGGPGGFVIVEARAAPPSSPGGRVVTAMWCPDAFPYARDGRVDCPAPVGACKLFSDLPLDAFLGMLRPPAPSGAGVRSGTALGRY